MCPSTKGQKTAGSVLKVPFPEKIFIWDREGTYVDCQFPNPVSGHFLGGATLQGKRVMEVLPPPAAEQILKGITRVLKQQEPSQLWICLSRENVEYRVCIRLIPSGPLVIGWVNDFRIEEEQKKSPSTQWGSKKSHARTMGCRPVGSRTKHCRRSLEGPNQSMYCGSLRYQRRDRQVPSL